MDLKRYKYIKNTRPSYDNGKVGFSPYDPTQMSLFQFNSMVGPKAPDLSSTMSALNPTNTVTNISKTAIPNNLQQSALKNVGLGTKLKAGINVAGDVISKYASPIMSGVNAIQGISNAFSMKDLKSEDQIASEAGSSEGQVDGISYEKMNLVDGEEQMAEVKAQNRSNTLGAAASTAMLGASVAGPIGGIVGGLVGGIAGIIGGNARKRAMERRIREAKRLNERINLYNRSGANTQALERNYYSDNDDNYNDILYANRGKDMNKVWTPSGYTNGHINSMVGKGESIINFNTGKGTLVTEGTKGVDNQPSSVKPGDSNVILGNDVDWTNGMKFSDQAAPYTARLEMLNNAAKRTNKYDNMSSLSKQTQSVQEREINRRRQPLIDALADISARQEKQHQIENKAASGAFFDDGKDIIPAWARMFPSAYGMLQSMNQYNRYKNKGLKYTNTYRSNPYANEALRGLASLRYDMYPELIAIRDAERRGNYGIMSQGGLTAGQRAAARIANTIATQNNLAKTYANASDQNNKYRAQYYDALINTGQADRAAKMSAAQQDYDNYARAHGAKYKGMDVATANKIDQLNNWFANEFKYQTYRDTSDIYRQQLSDEQKRIAANAVNSTAKVNNPVTQPTTTYATTFLNPNTFLNPFVNKPWYQQWKQPLQTFKYTPDYSLQGYLRRSIL